MQFIDIVKRLRQEAGIAGTGPTTVTAQTGELRRLVDWVASSWNDIQISKQDWLWMRGDFQFTCVPSQRIYTPAEAGIATRFSSWHLHSTRLGLTQNDETSLDVVSYDTFRAAYIIGPQVSGRPINVTTTPAMSLGIGYTPDQAYVVKGEYQKTPQALTSDSDVPEMPAQFHEAILYSALKKYARYMAAPEIYADADENYRRIYNLLCIHQLPTVTDFEAMA